MRLEYSLCFIYIALLNFKCTITLGDILRWTEQSYIPFLNPLEYFPENMKFSDTDIKTFAGTKRVPSSHQLRVDTGRLIVFLQVPKQRSAVRRSVGPSRSRFLRFSAPAHPFATNATVHTAFLLLVWYFRRNLTLSTVPVCHQLFPHPAVDIKGLVARYVLDLNLPHIIIRQTFKLMSAFDIVCPPYAPRKNDTNVSKSS